MPKDNDKAPAPAARVVGRLVGCQVALATVACVVCFGWFGRAAAASLLAGGAINILGGILMALRTLKSRAPNQPGQIVAAFFVGEVLKLALTVVLFTAAVLAYEVRFGFMLTGYFVTTLGYWLVLLRC